MFKTVRKPRLHLLFMILMPVFSTGDPDGGERVASHALLEAASQATLLPGREEHRDNLPFSAGSGKLYSKPEVKQLEVPGWDLNADCQQHRTPGFCHTHKLPPLLLPNVARIFAV